MTAKLYQPIQELSDTSIVHAGISMRKGGFSKAPYASFNLAFHVGDNPTVVSQNQRLFSSQTKIKKLRYCQQVHSDVVCHADSVPFSTWIKENLNVNPMTGDALISNRTGETLGIFTADCVPIFILDTATPAIGIAHAGWRGTIARIAAKTITAMNTTFGSHTKNCRIYLGASIQKCCYTVSTELVNQFTDNFGNDVKIEDRLCLHTANIKQLCDIGIQPESIFTSPYCTSCNTDLFYSHRAEGGQTGRMLSFIQLIH
ncbi:peptidoglycan editing factor PgeF [Candidatus Poribacteria bacterium]|nr:peptidoglycan editing factor PgeF [Candidatus Poribacteria bacterium]MYF55220.1 peptidoglycan editing factor PgeF [Candidatus Poribacteria bacterium]